MMWRRHPTKPCHWSLDTNASVHYSHAISMFLNFSIYLKIPSYIQLLIPLIKFRKSQPTKLSRRHPVHPQHLHLWAFHPHHPISKVVLTTGKTGSQFRASILSITTTTAPSTIIIRHLVLPSSVLIVCFIVLDLRATVSQVLTPSIRPQMIKTVNFSHIKICKRKILGPAWADESKSTHKHK